VTRNTPPDDLARDLALLIGPEQTWLTTEGFLEAVATNLEKAMA